MSANALVRTYFCNCGESPLPVELSCAVALSAKKKRRGKKKSLPFPSTIFTIMAATVSGQLTLLLPCLRVHKTFRIEGSLAKKQKQNPVTPPTDMD